MSAFDRTPCVQFQNAQGFVVVFFLLLSQRAWYLDEVPDIRYRNAAPGFLAKCPSATSRLLRGYCVGIA
ncbi:hypothetical protein [Paraburkholderia dilworthii]|uniref:hypothetical protein n=1 Tax=Paraburkholderia dilworthii TaxID=948106 RepID=UPI00040F2ECD|nr:hypothetical protein [Paraburkholderia dilworthii]